MSWLSNVFARQGASSKVANTIEEGTMADFSAAHSSRASADPDRVSGERNEPSINQAVSVQSRVSGILAVGLVLLLGVGALGWYYSNAIERHEQVRDDAKAAANNRAQGEMALPALGRIDPPQLTEDDFAAQAETLEEEDARLQEIADTYAATQPGYYPPPVQKTPEELALERRLSGVAFAAVQGASAPSASFAAASGEDARSSATRDGTLTALLKPAIATTVQAKVLPTQRFLLPKGTFIDCTLETAIDSTLPGMTTCITATDTFGADGKVVLLERGTKLFGETRGQVQQGSSRIFVLWTEARTPTGVVVPLDSPGADELGRSGLPGEVNRHFWDRFGAAILISTIDGAIQSAVQSSRGSGGTIIYNPTTSQDIMTEILKSTVNIPPTVTKAQGERIQILVARDLDFRSVYELRSAAMAR